MPSQRTKSAADRACPLPSKQTSGKRERSPAYTGGLCAVAAAFLPLANPVLFFLGSLPLFLTAFVLAIVSIVRGKVGGGLCFLVGLIFAFGMSVVGMEKRDDLFASRPTYNQ